MRTNYRLRTANTINRASEDTSPPSSHRIKVRAGLAVSNSKPGIEMNLCRSEDTNFPGYKKFDNNNRTNLATSTNTWNTKIRPQISNMYAFMKTPR
jgi:hypothetical protein